MTAIVAILFFNIRPNIFKASFHNNDVPVSLVSLFLFLHNSVIQHSIIQIFNSIYLYVHSLILEYHHRFIH